METNNNPQNTTQPENEEQELTDVLAQIDEELDNHGANIDAIIQTLPIDVQASIRAQLNQQQDSRQQQHLANLRHDVDDIKQVQQEQGQKTDMLHSAVQLLQQTLNNYYVALLQLPRKTQRTATGKTTTHLETLLLRFPMFL